MIFHRTPLDGAFLVEQDPRRDPRGSFARVFCAREFAAQGLKTAYVQANVNSNAAAGTIRGFHLQRPPHAETKLVQCIRGAIFDVIVDLREDSATYRLWYGAELSESNGLMMYVPAGFAHGYQALTDGATAHYLVSAYYEPTAEAGCRHDDPALGVRWPLPVTSVSEKDTAWPLL